MIQHVDIDQVRPSPENDQLYRPPDHDDPAMQQLAASIGEQGVLEPLVITSDLWIVSGHRRHAAAKMAGLQTVPCRVLPIRRDDDRDAFVRQLAEHNRQRMKTNDERLREEVVNIDPDQAYESLVEHRRQKSGMPDFLDKIELGPAKMRKRITGAKQPMLQRYLGDHRRVERLLAAVGPPNPLRDGGA